MPAFCHKPHSSCSARRLSSQDTFSVWTAPQSSPGTSRKSARRVRMRALGQSGSVRAQQSRPPFGCARKPRKVPHLPLLDGSVSPAEDTPYLSLYLTCQVHHLATRRHRQSVRLRMSQIHYGHYNNNKMIKESKKLKPSTIYRDDFKSP